MHNLYWEERKTMEKPYPECTHCLIFLNLESREKLQGATTVIIQCSSTESFFFSLSAYWKFADGGNFWHIYLVCSSWQITRRPSQPKFNRCIPKPCGIIRDSRAGHRDRGSVHVFLVCHLVCFLSVAYWFLSTVSIRVKTEDMCVRRRPLIISLKGKTKK